jgi:hypothetical protein
MGPWLRPPRRGLGCVALIGHISDGGRVKHATRHVGRPKVVGLESSCIFAHAICTGSIGRSCQPERGRCHKSVGWCWVNSQLRTGLGEEIGENGRKGEQYLFLGPRPLDSQSRLQTGQVSLRADLTLPPSCPTTDDRNGDLPGC